MNHSSGKESELIAELFQNNEKNTNRIISFGLLLIGILLVAFAILTELGFFELLSRVVPYLMLFDGIADIVAYAAIRRSDDLRAWHKWLCIIAIMLSSGVVYFFFPLNIAFITYGPILLSALYYDPPLVRKTTFVSWISYGLLMWANVVLESRNETMTAIHAAQSVNLWKSPMEVLLYRHIPHTVFFVVTAIICVGIAKGGKNLVMNKAEITSEILTLDEELRLASDIQVSSMPDGKFKSADGNISIDALMRPARIIGGDFYDYFTVGDNIVFLIADVSDKGLSAAMFMMKVKNEINNAVSKGTSLESALSAVNDEICRVNRDDMFVTLWIASVNSETGIGKYVNCGHLPPIVKHGDGSAEVFENEPELVLGVFEGIQYTGHPLELKADDELLLYTDGLTDAFNGEGDLFGAERLKLSIENTLSGNELKCKNLFDIVDAFADGAEQPDDMTALCIKLAPGGESFEDSFTVEAEENSVSDVIDRTNKTLRSCECPEDVRREIDVIIDEICSNIVQYAYPDGAGEISVGISAGENYVRLRFGDRGIPFNPLSTAVPDTDEIEVGGIGVFLVRELADCVDYSYSEGENIISVLKIWEFI